MKKILWLILLTYILILAIIMGLKGGISAFLIILIPNVAWLISLMLMTEDTLEDITNDK